MRNLVPADQIEQIVGVSRHPQLHYGRAVSAEQRVYILHSAACRDSGIDLRSCDFSRALDRGIDHARWERDAPVVLCVIDGQLLTAASL